MQGNFFFFSGRWSRKPILILRKTILARIQRFPEFEFHMSPRILELKYPNILNFYEF